MPALAKRMASPALKYQWTASLDYGAFEGSLGKDLPANGGRKICAAELAGPSHLCLPIHGRRHDGPESMTALVQCP